MLSVADAADRLGVDPSRVRQLLRAGELAGMQVSGVWVVEEEGVARRADRPPSPSRPMSPSRAWGLLDLLDGGKADWLDAPARSQVRAFAARLTFAPAQRWRDLLRRREQRLAFLAHPAAVRRVVQDERVVVGGPAMAAASGLDLVAPGAATAEVWCRPEDVAPLVRAAALRPVVSRASADLVVRVPREVWPFPAGLAGPSTVAATLLDSDEPRAEHAAEVWLQQQAAAAGSQ